MRSNIRGIMSNPKGLILTSTWMLMIIASLGQEPYGESLIESVVPFLNYNMSRCHGTWYEVEKYNGLPINLHKCVTIDFGGQHEPQMALDGTFLETAYINVTEISKSTGKTQLLEGSAVNMLSGVLVLSLNDSEYWDTRGLLVLAIDYDKYAVVSVCVRESKFCVSAEVLILTRQRQPPESVLQNARQAIRDKGLPLNNRVQIDQTDCPET